MVFVDHIPEMLESQLPEIIKSIATKYNVFPFIKNPDFLEERLIKWHQHGLLTHSKKVRKVFVSEFPKILDCWHVLELYHSVMDKQVEGTCRSALFEISIPIHDLGKIVVYGDERVDRSHEVFSKNLVYDNLLNSKLKSFGLSSGHINLISEYIENHDTVGKQLRDSLKHEGRLNLEYFASEKENIIKRARDLMAKYPDIKFEVGIYFLCDSLGKTDLRISAETSQDIEKQEQMILRELEARNLNPCLKYAVMQLPVNLKLAEIYLKYV